MISIDHSKKKIKIKLEDDLIKSVEKVKVYYMKIIKLEDNILWMYTYLNTLVTI
jgi:hypothetical protein